MLTIIYGASGSGKSEYAEELLMNAPDKNKYYLATMKVSTDEDLKRVERHKKLRAGKGFWAVEQEDNISDVLDKISVADSALLLECMSNLVANEMFKEDATVSSKEVSEKIISEIKKINKKINNFFIVTNNVFDDGCEYDEVTMDYLKALSIVNMRLFEIAGEAYEIVAGIPIRLK